METEIICYIGVSVLWPFKFSWFHIDVLQRGLINVQSFKTHLISYSLDHLKVKTRLKHCESKVFCH